jgi:hypothetical protein
MMTNSNNFHVELERLASLSRTLQDLANQAGSLRSGPAACPNPSVPGGMEPAVLEAFSIANDLVDSVLVTTVKDRLSQTGQLMLDVANQYSNADEASSSLNNVMSSYANATGNWDVLEAPK